MKKFSKILSGVMALAMVGTMGVTAFAASETLWVPSEEGDSSISETSKDLEIKVKVSDVEGQAEAVYCVGIEYDPLTFNYTKAKPAYDPKEHTMSQPTGSWSEAKTVKIVNHSNAQVYAKAELTDDEGGEYVPSDNDGITLTLGGNGLTDLNGTTAIAAENVAGFTSTQGTHQSGDNEKTLTITAGGDPSQNKLTETLIAKLKITVSSSEITEAA